MAYTVKCSECNEIMDYINIGQLNDNLLYQCPNCKKVRGISTSIFNAVESADPKMPKSKINNYLKKHGVIIEIDKKFYEYSQKEIDEPL